MTQTSADSMARVACGVVTGATSGIGRAIARRLANRGVSLYLVGRRVESLDAAARGLEGRARILTCQGDLCRESDLRDFAARVNDAMPRLDYLIHSAALHTRGAVEAGRVEDLDRLFQINVRAPYLLSQLLMPGVRAARGDVVFLNSTQGLNAAPGVAQYAVTKHALRALADSLRGEVNAAGVRVLTVFAGRTATPLTEATYGETGAAYRPELLLGADDIAATVLHALDMPRRAEVTEIHIRPTVKSY